MKSSAGLLLEHIIDENRAVNYCILQLERFLSIGDIQHNREMVSLIKDTKRMAQDDSNDHRLQ